jgi:hypothetical protein
VEGLDFPDHLHQHILGKIVCFHGVSRVNQRPAMHHRIRVFDERPERVLVALTGPVHEVQGKLEPVIAHVCSPCVVLLSLGRCVARWRLPDRSP